MITTSSDLPIKIKQDGKKSSRLLSKEVSMGNSSVEVYYGGSSLGIPFTWESQPGTPKVRFRETPLPPLTPPPSYHSSPAKKPAKKHSKSKLLHNVLPKLAMNNHSPTSPASSASSSSSLSWASSYSVPSSPLCGVSSSFDSRIDEEESYQSPVTSLCFGFTTRGANARPRGRFSSMIKVLFGEFA